MCLLLTEMALSTSDLNTILGGNNVTKKSYIGTFPSCMHPLSSKKIYSFITNTDNHHYTGTHWNAWYVKNATLTFFDSFGRNYNHQHFPQYYKEIAGKFKNIRHSPVQLQSLESSTCGHFCVKFIYCQSLGIDLAEFLDDFSKNLYTNDYNVLDFVRSIL